MATILVVEDDRRILEALSYTLQSAGHGVWTATSGEAAVELTGQVSPDLIVMDIMLERMDGITAVKRIRMDSATTILMLTALNDEDSVLRAFEAGADDYLVKPFRPRELVARVQALLRRTRMSDEDGRDVLKTRELTLDFDKRQVLLKGESVELSPTEMGLLFYLARNRQRVVGPEELTEQVWRYRCSEQEAKNLVKAATWRLREKIQDNKASKPHVVTVRGEGYRFDG